MTDDTWRLISELCQRVVEEQNVYLEIHVLPTGMLMYLYPCGDDRGMMNEKGDTKQSGIRLFINGELQKQAQEATAGGFLKTSI